MLCTLYTYFSYIIVTEIITRTPIIPVIIFYYPSSRGRCPETIGTTDEPVVLWSHCSYIIMLIRNTDVCHRAYSVILNINPVATR